MERCLYSPNHSRNKLVFSETCLNPNASICICFILSQGTCAPAILSCLLEGFHTLGSYFLFFFWVRQEGKPNSWGCRGSKVEERVDGDEKAESFSGFTLLASLLAVPPHQQIMQSARCFTGLHHYQEQQGSVGVQVEMPWVREDISWWADRGPSFVGFLLDDRP